MLEGYAGGIQPWWHFISAYHEDRRQYQTPVSLLRWHAEHEAYLIDRQPVATVGVVWSQENIDFFGRDQAHEQVVLPYNGMIKAMIRARIPYLPIHADHIARDAAQLTTLILPYGVSKHGVLALSEGLARDLKMRGAKLGASVLCPGFVNTQIFDAERNRPSELVTGDAQAPGMAELAKAMLAQGKPPEEIAEIVFTSIAEDRFYILPHPAWDSVVQRRVEHVLARGAPLSIDPQDMASRRAAGEQF
jgi:hypothetical protein